MAQCEPLGVHLAGLELVANDAKQTRQSTSHAPLASMDALISKPLVILTNCAPEFGGDWEAWQFAQSMSTARMTGYLSEWAVLEPQNAK